MHSDFVSMAIVVIIVYLIVVKPMMNNIISCMEGFDVTDNSIKDNSLYLTLSHNCDKRYCALNAWSNDDVTLPKGYVLGNFSTSSGCCIIPEKLNEYIMDAKGGNEYKM